MTSPHLSVLRAALERELLANRVNRFLHVHLMLAFTDGLLPFLAPGDTARAAPWWVLQAVLYCLSLATLLLGLNSAQAEADEFPILLSQPAPRWVWLLGKTVGLAALVVPAALLLVLPAALAGGVTGALVAITAAAAGLSLALAAVGLGLGYWLRDHVRGLLAALALWFALLFGTDIALLAVAGAPVVQAHASVWVMALMLNPLDALRVTVLFGIEQAAPAGLDAGHLAGWWIAHGGLWLVLLLATWTSAGLLAGLAGARRSLDA
jgi:hypothetical protein